MTKKNTPAIKEKPEMRLKGGDFRPAAGRLRI
jgi:hypothetical protein